ncbi:ribonuclease H [Trifolium pratense]|uniref:Ribonuclease H n=1 Tax=Trifolium pratense TaxID=57577 RepID=A0A2K3K3M3_TRIPR|nr:ribonuclease H [Trifolium pratense]
MMRELALEKRKLDSLLPVCQNLCGIHDEDGDSVWRKVWHLKVPERVRTLVWMTVHNRLLTNSLKSEMGLSHALCDSCGDVEETTLHVMRDCPRAKNIWNCVIPSKDKAISYMGDLQHWISFNIHNSMQWMGSGKWCDFWAYCCYCLWQCGETRRFMKSSLFGQ